MLERPEKWSSSRGVKELKRAGLEAPGLYFEKDRRRRLARRMMATVTLLDTLYLGGYQLPIAFEEYRLSQTHASIDQVFPADQSTNSDQTTIIFGGFGTRDSFPIAKALEPLDKLGNLDSVEEDNDGVNAEALAQQIIERATATHQTEIGLWGDSMGGLLAAKVARYIQEDSSPLRVRYVMFDCTPTSFDTLRASSQQGVNIFNVAAQIAPDIELHPVVEYFYTSVQLGDSPVYAASGVHGETILNSMYNPATPSTKLLASEATLIFNSQLQDDLAAISHVSTKQPPIIMSIRPTSSTGDAIVNSNKAEEQLKSVAAHTGLVYQSFSINGISHGDPTANRKAYQQALNSTIIPYVLKYEYDYQLAIDSLGGSSSAKYR